MKPISLIIGFFLTYATGIAQVEVNHITKLMGSRFELAAVAQTDTLAWEAIHAGVAEITRIERLISSWDPTSQTSEINRKAGIAPVAVADELFQLIQRGKKVSQLTQGAFDLSFASIENIWRFDGSMKGLPDSIMVEGSVRFINYQQIILAPEKRTVFLKTPEMKIGFGAIGKGYAANRAAAIMQERGIISGLVNAGGDLLAWGTRANGTPWKIGIADPEQKDQVKCWIPIEDMAVVTSGDYEKFLEFNGVRYGHIIDPRTGWPAQGLKSVTVICSDAELADALATSVFVLGLKDGMGLINQLKGVEALIIDASNQFHQSQNLNLNFYK
ncbi:MAG: FAD:protein FMN transferase [Bacteroidota bacterium]